MSSATSTEKGEPAAELGFQAWHLYLLLGMVAATVAVWRSSDTQPAALLLLSAAAIAAGLVAVAVHYTVLGFQGRATLDSEPIDRRTRRLLEQEKARVLRSIKELEFDRAMRKVSDADFVELDGRLRERALTLMAQLDEVPGAPVNSTSVPERAPSTCEACGTVNDVDARFCKSCGQALHRE
jgi:hypothetical protein